jgi:hypothetical protein
MSRKVELLRLSGMSAREAVGAAEAKLNDRSVADLSSLLVIDDTIALPDHGDAFECLLTSGRLRHLICISVGPPARPDYMPIPGSISAGRGSAVLWVGDQLGVDCNLDAAAVALIRPDGSTSAVRQLTELLTSTEVFDRVRELCEQVPNGVACPGLRLAEAEAGTADFPAALTSAIQRLTQSQADRNVPSADPFPGLLETYAGGQRLDDGGQLRAAEHRCRSEAEEADIALMELAGLPGLLPPGQALAAARDRAAAAGNALTSLRALVAQLLEDGNAIDGLTDRQRRRLRQAGILLADRDSDSRLASGAGTGVADRSEQEAVSACISTGLQRPGGLPQTEGQLAATERLLKPRGSRTYLPQIDQCCPPELSRRLLHPPPFTPLPSWLPAAGALAAAGGGLAGIIMGLAVAVAWTLLVILTVVRTAPEAVSAARWRIVASLAASITGAVAGWQVSRLLDIDGLAGLAGLVAGLLLAMTLMAWSWRARVRAWQAALAPRQAGSAAGALTDLVAVVAQASWSADPARLEAVARARIAIDGVRDELCRYAEAQPTGDSARQPLNVARLAEVLSPTLADLVLTVVDAQPVVPAADGEDDYRIARLKTEELVGMWSRHAEEHGPLMPPPFAKHGHSARAYATEAGEDAIRATAGYDPRGVMWQLCRAGDLRMLDIGGELLTVPFAPRTAEPALARVLPASTAWTSSGHRAGLLRLVPLRGLAGVTPSWGSSDLREEDA